MFLHLHGVGALPHLNGDISGEVGAENAHIGIFEACKRLRFGVTVTVAGTAADQRKLRSQNVEQLWRDGFSAPVVADLEHVDVAHRAGAHHLIEHHRLRITGEQCRELATRREHDHARLVFAPVLNRPLRPHHSEPELADAELGAFHNLPHLGSHALEHLEDLGLIIGRPCRKKRGLDRHESLESLDPVHVVRMQVSADKHIDAPQPMPSDCSPQLRRAGPRIDERCPPSIAHKDRIALPDIKHRDSLSAGGQRDATGSDSKQSAESEDSESFCGSFTRLRPARPDGDAGKRECASRR